jgi:hypothetical protein
MTLILGQAPSSFIHAIEGHHPAARAAAIKPDAHGGVRADHLLLRSSTCVAVGGSLRSSRQVG